MAVLQGSFTVTESREVSQCRVTAGHSRVAVLQFQVRARVEGLVSLTQTRRHVLSGRERTLLGHFASISGFLISFFLWD